LGCRVYERACFAIKRAVTLPEYSWLGIVEHVGLRFVFKVGDVPLRFYSADPEHPPLRATQCGEGERLAQFELLDFLDQPDEDQAAERVWRLMIETENNLVSAITIEQVDAEGNVYNPWNIPLDGVTEVVRFDTRQEGIEVPPLEIGSARATPDDIENAQ